MNCGSAKGGTEEKRKKDEDGRCHNRAVPATTEPKNSYLREGRNQGAQRLGGRKREREDNIHGM